MATLGARRYRLTWPRRSQRVAAGGPAPTSVRVSRRFEPPEPDGDRSTDIAGLMENRWAPLVEEVLSEIGDGGWSIASRAVSNDEVLRRFGRSRILVWPSPESEGHRRRSLDRGAARWVRARGTHRPVSRTATEQYGAVAGVGARSDPRPAADQGDWSALSARGAGRAREHEAGGPACHAREGLARGCRASGPGPGDAPPAASRGSARGKVEADARGSRLRARVELDVARAI